MQGRSVKLGALAALAALLVGVFAVGVGAASSYTNPGNTGNGNIKGGTATVKLSATAKNGDKANGITLSAIAPATKTGPKLSFGIKSGTLTIAKKLTGTIVLKGGVTVTAANGHVDLMNLTITRTPAKTTLSASISGTTLDIGSAKIKKVKTTGKTSVLTGELFLNKVAVSTVNGLTTSGHAFTAPEDLGSFTVTVKLA